MSESFTFYNAKVLLFTLVCILTSFEGDKFGKNINKFCRGVFIMDKQLVSEIEKARKTLFTTANGKSLLSDEVVKQSHNLDQLIAAYYGIHNEK